MGRLLPAAVLLAALAACSTPCRDLGDRLCRCTAAGTSRETCERQVKQDLDRLDPSADQDDLCSARLDTCNAPDGAEFCEWIETTCGKASCGLSVEAPGDVCP
jgi:hypothetical protein